MAMLGDVTGRVGLMKRDLADPDAFGASGGSVRALKNPPKRSLSGGTLRVQSG